MSTRRWTLSDPEAGETWTMPINPDSAEPVPAQQRTFSSGAGRPKDPRVRLFLNKPDPLDWGWGGVIRTQDHYDELVRWAQKPRPVTLVDHLNREFRIYITAFEPEDRRPTARLNTRWRYTMKVKVLAGPKSLP